MTRRFNLLDLIATIYSYTLLVIGILIVIIRQTIWRVGFGNRTNTKTKYRRRLFNYIDSKISVGLPDGTNPIEEETPRKLRILKRNDKAANGSQAIHYVVEKVFLRFNPFWTRIIEYEVPIEELSKETYVYMSNHTSFADFLMFAGLGFNFVGVGKSNLYKVPVAQTVLENAGFLPVYFELTDDKIWTTNKPKTRAMCDTAVEYLQHGMSIGVFPEGEIGTGEGLLEFKFGFFKVARRANAKIVPMAAYGCDHVWPMSEKSNGVPSSRMNYGKVCVKIGKPLDVLNDEECEEFDTSDDFIGFLEDKFEVDFKDTREICNLFSLIDDLIHFNQIKDTKTENYHQTVGEIFKLTFRKKIFEMKCEMKDKLAKLNK